MKKHKLYLFIGVTAFTIGALTSCTIEINIGGNNVSESIEEPTISEKDSLEPKPSLPDMSVSESSPSTEPIKNYVLKFADEFDGNSLNRSVWNVETGTGSNYNLTDWGNGEAQYYIEDSLKVSNGTLKITAKREHYGNKEFTSGRIQTRDKVYYTYGYFESRIKMPVGVGLWPAFWMLPNNDQIYHGWASSGEIDIMEVKGRFPYEAVTTLHFGDNWPNNKYKGETHKIPNGGRIDDFHTYGAEWTSEYIAFYIDRQFVYRITNSTYYSVAAPNNPSAPFDEDFYLLLNFAIGGNFDGYRMPENSFTSADMEVDYVRVWQVEQ